MRNAHNWNPTPPSAPLTGSALPKGLAKAWPSVVAAWRHESDVWLAVQVLGRVAVVAWRVRPTYLSWPFDSLICDESEVAAENVANAMANASALLAIGPSGECLQAKEEGKERNRINAREAYRKKKENRSQSPRDIKKMVRHSIADILGLGEGGDAAKPDIATAHGAAETRGRKESPSLADTQREERMSQRRRELLSSEALNYGVDPSGVEAYRTQRGNPRSFAVWLATEEGKATFQRVRLQVESEFAERQVS